MAAPAYGGDDAQLRVRAGPDVLKEAVNRTVDNMGFYDALNACFTRHELNHSHRAQVNDDGYPVAEEDSGIPSRKEAPPILPAVKDKVRAERWPPPPARWRVAPSMLLPCRPIAPR